MSHHCASVGQTEAQDSGRSGKSEVRPTRGLKGSVGKRFQTFMVAELLAKASS